MLSLNLLEVFINPLEQNKILYFVTGSIASIFYGEPRLTHDVDIVLHLTVNDVQHFPAIFPLALFYCPPEEVIQIESKRQPYGHFNLIHHSSGFKADIYADAGDRLHQWAFKHRKHVELAKNLSLWLAPAEYLIIRKLEYFREGGSEKHLEDIRKMLPQVSKSLEGAFLENEISNRGLSSTWNLIQKRI